MCTHPAAIFSGGVEAFESGETRDGTLALAKFVGPRGKCDLFVRFSLCHHNLRNACPVSRSRWHPADNSSASTSLPLATSGWATRTSGLGAPRLRRNVRHSFDFYRYAEPPEAVALRAHCFVRGWHSFRRHGVASFAWVVRNDGSAACPSICSAGARHRGDCGSYVVVARSRVEERQSHRESANACGFDGRRG